MRRWFATAIQPAWLAKKPPRPKRELLHVSPTRCHTHTKGCWRRARSPARWPFNLVQQLVNIVIAQPGRQAQLSRSDHERLSRRPRRRNQPQPQEAVHHFFKGRSRAPAFLFEQPGNVVVKRKSSSHIMILCV